MARAGIITDIYDDGTVRVAAVGDSTQVYFGELSIMSGGNVVFTVKDDRRVTVSAHSDPTAEGQTYTQNEPPVDPTEGKEKVGRSRVKIG